MILGRRAPLTSGGRPRRVVVAVAAVLAAGGLAACGSGSDSGTGAAGTSSRPSVGSVAVDDAANGTTVRLARGQRVTVTLHNTYWQLAPPSDSLVLAATTAPVPRPDPSCRSIPGTGCGSVTATYTASAAGTAVLTAHRESCGEALRCTGGQGDWTVTVRVAG